MQANLLRYDTTSTFIFIDLETFNLNLSLEHNLPWQIAMLKVKNSEIIDKINMYVKWNTNLKISKEAAEITRYNQKTVDNLGIDENTAFNNMYNWLSQADYIIGHNILNFDMPIIYNMYYKFGKNPKSLISKCLDTNALAKGWKLQIPYKASNDIIEYQLNVIDIKKKGLKTNLMTLGKEMEISHDYDNLHDALVDLELNKKVWDKLKLNIDI
jgi:DNA polymerase III alpha subunit (gram-positive type)